tara:strand:+ start:410 stop:883 length:474 start_codon:yes stop_codon:yes gene_type:complete
MKKLLLLTSLFFVLSCTKGKDGLVSFEAFLTKYDGTGFVYSGEISDQYIFFYDSDIFLKEVEVYYPDLDTYCDSVKRGSNTDDGYNFSAEILVNDPKDLEIKISYTDEEGNAISSNYFYREVCNTPTCTVRSIKVTQDDGSVKTYSETSVTHSSLCN